MPLRTLNLQSTVQRPDLFDSSSAQTLQSCLEGLTTQWADQGVQVLSTDRAFYSGNEHQPQYGMPIFSRVPGDSLYVSVGCDRGFIGAGLSGARSLLLADHAQKAVVFSQINTALLKMSHDEDVEHYRHLRLRAREAEWRLLRRKLGLETEQKLLKDPQTFLWWKKNVRKHSGFSYIHTNPATSTENFYHGVNYLYDEQVFTAIESIAKSSNIASVLVDFNQPERVAEMLGFLRDNGFIMGALDLSNSWKSDIHMGTDRVQSLVLAVLPYSHDNSLLILTRLEEEPVLYFAYTFCMLQSLGRRIADHLDNVMCMRFKEETIDMKAVSNRRYQEGRSFR